MKTPWSMRIQKVINQHYDKENEQSSILDIITDAAHFMNEKGYDIHEIIYKALGVFDEETRGQNETMAV